MPSVSARYVPFDSICRSVIPTHLGNTTLPPRYLNRCLGTANRVGTRLE